MEMGYWGQGIFFLLPENNILHANVYMFHIWSTCIFLEYFMLKEKNTHCHLNKI